MSALTDLTNIGKEMANKLNSVAIFSPSELIELGSKQAFFRLKTKYPQMCLVHLYAIEGAIQNVPFNLLSEQTKQDLKAFSDSMNQARHRYRVKCAIQNILFHCPSEDTLLGYNLKLVRHYGLSRETQNKKHPYSVKPKILLKSAEKNFRAFFFYAKARCEIASQRTKLMDG